MAEDIDGIKQSLIKQGHEVHDFVVGSHHFLYRPLTIKELSAGVQVDSLEAEEFYIKTATLYPPDVDFDKIKAGYVTRYADDVLEASGFDNLGTVNNLLEKHRAKAENNIIHKMKSYILTAMPLYREEEIDSLQMDEFVRLVVLAEEIITVQQSTAGLDTTGFKLVIRPVGAEEPEPQPQPAPKKKAEERIPPALRKPERAKSAPPKMEAPAPPKAPPQQAVEEDPRYKQELIDKIKWQNHDLQSVDKYRQVDPRPLEQMDIASLERILGITRSDDPIAAKLNSPDVKRKVMRMAQKMGLPYDED